MTIFTSMKSTPTRRRPRASRLYLESLEDRRLLSITVNTLVDELDGSIVDGDISLRDAIAAAPSGETINFAITGRINLTLGELPIHRDLTINGPGASLLTIEANDPTPNVNNGDGSRVFQINDGNSVADKAVAISGLTLTGGDMFGDGGGIRNAENLTVTDSTISGNVAHGTSVTCGYYTCYSYDHVGGGIWNSGSLAVNGSTISGNEATGGGGGILSTGNLIVTNSAVSGNSAASHGGGVSATNLAVTGSTISGNSAGGSGGGFFGGNLTITGSTISGNSAGYDGGGIYSGYYGNVTVTNGTVSGNTARTAGGGVFNNGGQVVIEFSTVTCNQAPAGRGSGVASSGDSYTRTQVRSSIIAGNMNSDVNFVSGGFNSFQSSGYNLIGTGNAVGRFNQAGDQTGVTNPLLGPLTDNGGLTRTHSLLPGSPAIDRGDPAAVAGGGVVPLSDQRGAPWTRVFDGDSVIGARIDIGAFEAQPLAVDGDFNDDGLYDLADIDALVAEIAPGSHGLAFDLTGDSLVDLADRDAWLSEAGAVNLPSGNSYLLGDANLDGVVDGSDFGSWNAHKFTSVAAWSSGDFNADGAVDGSDFGVWNGSTFTSAQRPHVNPVGGSASVDTLPVLLAKRQGRIAKLNDSTTVVR